MAFLLSFVLVAFNYLEEFHMACNEKEVLRERLYDNKALKMFFKKKKVCQRTGEDPIKHLG
jgi:hypothetical protein